MKRLVCCSVLALSALVATSASAQTAFLVGAGASITSGDFADIDSVKTGTSIMGGVDLPFRSGLTLRLDGLLSQNDRITDFNESQHLAAIYARAAYWLPLNMSSVKPYLMGGLGYMYSKYNPGQKITRPHSESGVVFSGGVGTEVQLGPVATFLEGRYETGSEVKAIMPIFIGVRLKTGS
jgi:hypothetical protein